MNEQEKLTRWFKGPRLQIWVSNQGIYQKQHVILYWPNGLNDPKASPVHKSFLLPHLQIRAYKLTQYRDGCVSHKYDH